MTTVRRNDLELSASAPVSRNPVVARATRECGGGSVSASREGRPRLRNQARRERACVYAPSQRGGGSTHEDVPAVAPVCSVVDARSVGSRNVGSCRREERDQILPSTTVRSRSANRWCHHSSR